MDEDRVIVMEPGSRFFKIGSAYRPDVPECCFQSIVERFRNPNGTFYNVSGRDHYTGGKTYYLSGHRGNVDHVEIERNRQNIITSNPIEYGLITNWADMELIWHHSFYDALRTAPEEHLILIAEVPLNPKATRERMAQNMFETFWVSGLSIFPQPVLALYDAGKVTGLVLDSGDTVTHSVPVFEGFMIPHAIERIKFGGRDLTNYMNRLLTERGYNVAEREIVEEIKKKLCYIANDFDAEADSSLDIERTYEVPNGGNISIGNERFRCPEALFQPRICHLDNNGVHEMIYSSIVKCNSELRTEMYENIVLAGGSTMFDGFRERLEREVALLAPEHMEVKVIAPPDRRFSTWRGGSKIASLPNFPELCMTRKEYEEFGPAKIHMNSCKTLQLFV